MDRLPPVLSTSLLSSFIESSKLVIPTNIYNIGSPVIRHTIFSKGICNDSWKNVPFKCYEMGHSWNPSCFGSSFYLFWECFKKSIVVYGLLYTVSKSKLKN